MRSRRAVLALLGSMCAAVVLMPGRAFAEVPSIAASGSYTVTSFVASNSRTEGQVTLFDFTGTEDLTGTFSGTVAFEGSCAVRPAGIASCVARETFTGTVAGPAGTVVWLAPAQLSLDSGSISGKFIIVSGTGDLAGLHGEGTFAGSLGPGTYTGRFVLAP
jgi:hypothetical protein